MIRYCGEVMGNKQEKKFGDHLEGIAFGMPDGVICFLGIIIGTKATQDLIMVLISNIAGGAADALRTSFGFLISQLTERFVQRHRNETLGKEVRLHSKSEVWLSEVLSCLPIIFALLVLITSFLRFKQPICII
jgi:hypothetical protein